MKLTYNVEKKYIGCTINEILLNEFHFSSRLFAKLKKNNKIYLNHLVVDTRSFASLNDLIEIDLSYEENTSNIIPTKMDLSILYEDEWLIALDKPSGIAIHPSSLHYDNSLANGLCYYYKEINLKKKIRPINRLDFYTSGVVLFAKCEYIQEELIKQMAKGIFKKEYLCFIEGKLSPKQGSINLPIARKESSIIERCVNETGKNAITHYKVLKEFPNYSLIKCTLETGRTHQIRVHTSYLSHPIIGDTLYGKESTLISRQALHSYKLSCIHPITKKPLTFFAILPKDMKTLL